MIRMAVSAWSSQFGLAPAGMTMAGLSMKSTPLSSSSLQLPILRSATNAAWVDPAGAPLPPLAVGRLQLRGPHLCKGYWQNPRATAEAFDAADELIYSGTADDVTINDGLAGLDSGALGQIEVLAVFHHLKCHGLRINNHKIGRPSEAGIQIGV